MRHQFSRVLLQTGLVLAAIRAVARSEVDVKPLVLAPGARSAALRANSCRAGVPEGWMTIGVYGAGMPAAAAAGGISASHKASHDATTS
jgi:hypothetical protein